MSFECDYCVRTFSSRRGAEQHMDDLDHWRFECETCTKVFVSQTAANQHMNAVNHRAPMYECETCSHRSRSWSSVEKHMDANGHWEHWCKKCERKFSNKNSLDQHLKSRAHLGATIACPFCKTGFVTASGLSHHLEGGSCPKAQSLDRQKIWQLVRKRDPSGFITKNLLEFPGYTLSQEWNPRSAWNGYGYECYLCHRAFEESGSLTQHLKSPTHQQNVYHCPNRILCGKEFVSLAALFNHLESESCKFIKFESVQKGVHSVMSGNRLISFN